MAIKNSGDPNWPSPRDWIKEITDCTVAIERDEFGLMPPEDPTPPQILDTPKEVLYVESTMRRLDGPTVQQIQNDIRQFEMHLQHLPDLDIGALDAEVQEMDDALAELVSDANWTPDTCAMVHRRIMQYRPRIGKMRRIALAYHMAFQAAKPYFWSVAQAPYISQNDTSKRSYAWYIIKPFVFSFERVEYALKMLDGMLEMLHSMGEAAVREMKEREYALNVNGRIVGRSHAVLMEDLARPG